MRRRRGPARAFKHTMIFPRSVSPLVSLPASSANGHILSPHWRLSMQTGAADQCHDPAAASCVPIHLGKYANSPRTSGRDCVCVNGAVAYAAVVRRSWGRGIPTPLEGYVGTSGRGQTAHFIDRKRAPGMPVATATDAARLFRICPVVLDVISVHPDRAVLSFAIPISQCPNVSHALFRKLKAAAAGGGQPQNCRGMLGDRMTCSDDVATSTAFLG